MIFNFLIFSTLIVWIINFCALTHLFKFVIFNSIYLFIHICIKEKENIPNIIEILCTACKGNIKDITHLYWYLWFV